MECSFGSMSWPIAMDVIATHEAEVDLMSRAAVQAGAPDRALHRLAYQPRCGPGGRASMPPQPTLRIAAVAL
ncbi:hypothetical protein [Xanthomonas sp. WHRI 7945]|nr:hypothetical protein [Xanthomonas campestris pv. campestris]